MSDVSRQLTHAYRRQAEHYDRIRQLVRGQKDVMDTSPDPASVLDLCRQVEELMAQVAVIEEAIEPAKRCWAARPVDPDGDLDGVLESIQDAIKEIVQTQEQVQQKLMEFVRQERQRSEAARASLMASRARTLYRAG